MRRAQIKKIQNGVSPLSYHASMQPRLFCTLACSRRSDRGDRAKRCEQKKKKQRGGWGRGWERSFLPLSLSSLPPYFSPALRAAFHYRNSYNRLPTRWVGKISVQSTPITRSYITRSLTIRFIPVSSHSKSKLWRQYDFKMVWMKPVDGYSQMEPPHLYYTNRIFLVFL